jgi:tetrahydromethanopterin S-methyltransferase subunit B|tara:strand:+ start:232 stop:624 length:393 start_codon:yes stop_codon:yes gene_type:complete
MADIPDFMREFDTDTDYGFTPVSQKPAEETSPAIDPKVVENSNLEIAKVKADVIDIKSMMNEVMQIVAEKDSVNKEIQDADVSERFKEIEKIVLPFLYNLSKSKEPYIHWPNRGPIIKAQMDKILKLTRG